MKGITNDNTSHQFNNFSDHDSLCLPSFASDSLVAQDKPIGDSQNAIYIEAFGPGIPYSINYDYRFQQDISVRIGFSSWSIPDLFSDGTNSLTTFPIMVNYLLGQGTDHLELGIGFVPLLYSSHGQELFSSTTYNNSGSSIYGAATIGYRLQRNDGGFVLRIDFTPMLVSGQIIP